MIKWFKRKNKVAPENPAEPPTETAPGPEVMVDEVPEDEAPVFEKSRIEPSPDGPREPEALEDAAAFPVEAAAEEASGRRRT